MDKLFEIVSSLVPDEQKADIKAKFDGELKKVIADNEKNIKKELSSTYKINFFEEDITKAYNGDQYVQKSIYNDLENQFKTLKDGATDFENEKTKLIDQVANYESNEKLYNSQLNLISNGLRVDRLELIKPHIKGDVDEDLKLVKENYPELFHGEQGRGQTHKRGDTDDDKSEMAKFFEKKAVNNNAR